MNYVFVAEDPICYMDLIRVMERSLYGILNMNLHNEETNLFILVSIVKKHNENY